MSSTGEERLDNSSPLTPATPTSNKSMNENKFQCDLCGKNLMTKGSLERHSYIHSVNPKPFKCPICIKSFSEKANVKQHLKIHKDWPQATPADALKENEGNPCCCRFCGLDLCDIKKLKRHMSDKHSESKVFKCYDLGCLKEFTSVSTFINDLNHHQYSQNRSIDDELEGNSQKHQCQVCHAVFRKALSLERHYAIESHHHVCSECNASFTTERYLRRHIALHTATLSCSICQKVLKSRKGLREHMASHSHRRRFCCDPCGDSFVSRFRLERHMKKHFGEEYHCPYGCSKSFYRMDKLRSHIASHSPGDTRPMLKKTEILITPETHVEIFQMSFID